jgi:hypothetical protein
MIFVATNSAGKLQRLSALQACSSSSSAWRRDGARWPSCSRCTCRMGSSRRASVARPSAEIRTTTRRRSGSSRCRDSRRRFSILSSRRVRSGSRVIMRSAICPHSKPSGAPRRMRSTLYCAGERRSCLRIRAGPRESRSVVRASSTNSDSSGQGTAEKREDSVFPIQTDSIPRRHRQENASGRAVTNLAAAAIIPRRPVDLQARCGRPRFVREPVRGRCEFWC